MKNWYLIHTKPRQELVALNNLERQGFECFLPKISVEKLRRHKLQVAEEALFPRYLFIRLQTGLGAQSWAPIRSTSGVSNLVSFGQSAAKISDELLAQLKGASSEASATRRYFEPGDSVVLTQGAFSGVEGIYQMACGESRVMVLLNILSKQVKMLMTPAGIQKTS